MRLRDRRNEPWVVEVSPIFDEAYKKRAAAYPTADELIDFVYSCLEDDPRSCGEPHIAWGDSLVWIWEFAGTAGFPRVFILYKIEDDIGRVTLCAFYLKPIPDFGIL